MSKDGTLPPGCSHQDVERAAGGEDDTATCSECSEPRAEDSVDGTMCNACAATHYHRLYRMMRAERQNEKVSDGGPLTHELKQDANPPFAAPLG